MAAVRGQGQRAGLTRQTILDAALRLVDRDGLKALSMRRLGAELGVEAMTLYHHVPNKDALLDGLVEQVVVRAEPPGRDAGSWDLVLRGHAKALLAALLAHPAVIPLVLARPAVTPANLGVVEASLAALAAAGFTPRQAVDITYSLSGFVVGQAAALAGAGQDEREHAESQLRQLSGVDEASFPLLAAAAKAGPGAAGSRFDFALDAMLTGFAAALPEPD